MDGWTGDGAVVFVVFVFVAVDDAEEAVNTVRMEGLEG